MLSRSLGKSRVLSSLRSSSGSLSSRSLGSTSNDAPMGPLEESVTKLANGDDREAAAVAKMLAQARIDDTRTGRPFLWGGDALLTDLGVEKGYWLQPKVTEALKKLDPDFELAGAKVGATNAAGQKRLGLTEPFFGPLYRKTVLLADSDKPISHSALCTRGIEAEWAFILSKDIPVRKEGEKLFTREDVSKFVHAVAPSIEVTGTRFKSPAAKWLFLADGAGNGSVILGAKSLWRDVNDPEVLRADSLPVKTYLGNELKCEGDGSQVLGHPLEGLLWLANKTNRSVLHAGDVILSGAANGNLSFPPTSLPSSVTVEFFQWGRLELTIDAPVSEKGAPFSAIGARPFKLSLK